MSENYEEVKVKDKVYIQGQFYLMNVKWFLLVQEKVETYNKVDEISESEEGNRTDSGLVERWELNLQGRRSFERT